MAFLGAEQEWLLESQIRLLLLTMDCTGLEEYCGGSSVLVFLLNLKFLGKLNKQKQRLQIQIISCPFSSLFYVWPWE